MCSPDCLALFGPLWRLDYVTFEQVGDEELVERFERGEAPAFSQLFRRHQPAVARLVSRMLGVVQPHRAATSELEDLIQDVFVQVYRSLGSFRGQSRLSTWIYRIAVNVVLMHRRGARARPTFARSEEAPVAVDPGLGPDDEVVQRRNVLALYRHLGRLSEKKRTVYILHEIEGLAPAEIARIVEAPVLTVRTRLFYARRELLASCREDPYLSTLLAELGESKAVSRESCSAMRIRTQVQDPSPSTGLVQEKLS
jgi:RNA polymerase sigma-70 factor, ECF subfamily